MKHWTVNMFKVGEHDSLRLFWGVCLFLSSPHKTQRCVLLVQIVSVCVVQKYPCGGVMSSTVHTVL